MDRSLKYFKDKEWSMGNGQCPDCCGVPKDWLGHPNYLTSKNIGHKHSCKLAQCLKELGGNPLMIGDFKDLVIYEIYITDDGFYSTRIKHSSQTKPQADI